MSDNETIYTIPEIAAKLRISQATAKRLCIAGEFPGSYKTGSFHNSRWRIPHSGLTAYLEKMKK